MSGRYHLSLSLLPLPTSAPWATPEENVWRQLYAEILSLHAPADRWPDLRVAGDRLTGGSAADANRPASLWGSALSALSALSARPGQSTAWPGRTSHGTNCGPKSVNAPSVSTGRRSTCCRTLGNPGPYLPYTHYGL
jgi:hypothetical protein